MLSFLWREGLDAEGHDASWFENGGSLAWLRHVTPASATKYIQVGSASDAALAPFAVTMGVVGLCVQGRASQFDLWYFFATRMSYCVDSRDDTFVASMPGPAPLDVATFAFAIGSRAPHTR